MQVRRLAAAGAAALLTIGFGIVAASPASADQVWNQSVGRASANASCPTNTAEETAAGWTEWAPSYAMWPNGGTGGFVCDRSITWAKDTPPPGAAFAAGGCRSNGDIYYFQFGDSFFVNEGSMVYSDAACTAEVGPISASNIYAPPPYDPAVLCVAAFGASATVSYGPYGDDLYTCNP